MPLNRPEFLRRLRVSSFAAVRIRRARASRSSHACAAIVEYLDVIERVLPCLYVGPVGPAPDPVAFEEAEEALVDCILVVIARLPPPA